jgi:hypothetical protein
MDKVERDMGRPSSGKLSREGQSSIYRDSREVRWRRPL